MHRNKRTAQPGRAGTGELRRGNLKIALDSNLRRLKIKPSMAKTVGQAFIGTVPQEAQNALQIALLELSGACPFDQTNPHDCPLFLLRKMEPERRLQWFHALPENDLSYLAAYHRVCLTTKVEAQLPRRRTQTPGIRGGG